MSDSELKVQPIKWFVAGPGGPGDLLLPDNFFDAGALVHAKTMGTLTSACGLTTSSWTKLWDIPFLVTPAARQCPHCRTIVRESLAGKLP